MDNLTTCPCERKSDALFEQFVTEDLKLKCCYGCGFISNSIMEYSSEYFQQQVEILPELYKDLIWQDEEGKCWMPSTVNIPEKGIIFANGTSKDEWGWAAVKSVEVGEDEKEKFPDPQNPGQFHKYKTDMSTMNLFNKYDYIGALEYIGALGLDS